MSNRGRQEPEVIEKPLWIGQGGHIRAFQGARLKKGSKVTVSAAYRAYREWCEQAEQGEPLGKIQFTREVRTQLRIEIRPGTNNTMYLWDWTLRGADETDAEREEEDDGLRLSPRVMAERAWTDVSFGGGSLADWEHMIKACRRLVMQAEASEGRAPGALGERMRAIAALDFATKPAWVRPDGEER